MTSQSGGRDERTAIVERGYDQLVDNYLNWSARGRDPGRARYLGEFAERLAAGAAVLDLGCGAGIPSTAELARLFKVTGVDVSAGQLEAARRNVPDAEFVHADISKATFSPGSFDGVVALYSISHVPREKHAALFSRIHSWLRPGGVFVATLGASGGDDWTGEWLGTSMFFSSFDEAENRRLLTAAGFELLNAEVIETAEPEGPVPFLWVLAQKATDL